MIDLGTRQSTETKLKDSIESLRETIKSSYQRTIHERVQGGVQGAGSFSSSFLSTLGFGGLAAEVKKNAEAKEMDRQQKEKYVQEFQDNDPSSQILTKGTAREIAEEMYEAKKNEGNVSSEDEIEANVTRAKQLEVQSKTSDDITDLFVISDDYFKAQIKHNEEMKKLFEQIRDTGAMGGGGGGSSLLGAAADMLGGRGGLGKAAGTAGTVAGTAAKTGKLAALASKFGPAAKIGGGLLAVGTAAYGAYDEYSEAEKQVQAGEITKEEGQVKKGEAVGGGVGAAGGALAGAKAGAALGALGGPIGMALGGLLGGAAGYVGGKFLGKKVGGTAVSGYQTVAPIAQALTPEAAPTATATATPAAAAPAVAPPAPAPAPAPKPAPVVEKPPELQAKRIQFNPDGTRKPTAAEVLRGESPPAPAPAPAPVVERPAPQTVGGETYDNRSAITGFTKEFLEGVANGTMSGPISAEQARDYLSKIQPGEAGYKKKFMRGKPIGAVPTETAPALPAETAPSTQAGDITQRRRGLEDAEAAATATPAAMNNTVVAPNTTNVVNNNAAPEQRSSRNTESSFQKFMDRRYHPSPAY